MSKIDGMDAAARKAHPLFTGCLAYFPDALLEVAHLSKIGNDQHNPGQPLHWSRGKSNDHADCLVRHQLDHGRRDVDGERHSAKVAWRALAQLQLEIEKDGETAVVDTPERRTGEACRRKVFTGPTAFMRRMSNSGRRSTDTTPFGNLPYPLQPLSPGVRVKHRDEGDPGTVHKVCQAKVVGELTDGALVHWDATGLITWYPLFELEAVS